MQHARTWFSVVGLAAAVGLFGLFTNAETADRKPEKKVKPNRKEAARPRSRAAALVAKLSDPITLEKGIDANTPLKDALEYITDHYGLTIVMDTKALLDATEDPKSSPEPEARPVKLPKMTSIPLGTALRLLLSQVNATYIVRDGFLEVTSLKQASAKYLFRQRVAAAFDDVPLGDALERLSDPSGVSVTVDVRVGDMARTRVSATLKNDVPFATAVRMLSDMAGLKAVRLGDALYVTTKDNAKLLQAEEDRLRKSDKKKAKRTKKEDGPKPAPVKPKAGTR
jgi:hypothetical protein